jgi:hypothetical protein
VGSVLMTLTEVLVSSRCAVRGITAVRSIGGSHELPFG